MMRRSSSARSHFKTSANGVASATSETAGTESAQAGQVRAAAELLAQIVGQAPDIRSLRATSPGNKRRAPRIR